MKLLIMFLLTFLFLEVHAQEKQTRKIALLPIVSNGIDLISVKTAESILRMELGKQNSINLISETKTLSAINEDCFEVECAQVVGKDLQADQVLLCKLNPLGEKIIVQYYLVETKTGKNKLAEQTTALNLDDLEPVMKRVALSVERQTSFSANTEVGNIVGNETLESLQRKARYNFGVDFGYLFPQKGYDNDIKSFTINAYFDHEIQQYAVGLMVGARYGFAINLYGAYLFSNTDFCPYLGTSLGFHWVNHESTYYDYDYNYNEYDTPKELSDNGISLGFKGGLRILHTYNVQLFVNLEYVMTFNDYNDRAIIFTIGIL